MLWTLAWCPAMQLNSDIICLETHQISQVKGSVLQDCVYIPNPQFHTPVASPDRYLYFWPTGYKSEVPTTPSFEFNSFAIAAHKTQKTFCLLDHQIVIKACNSGTARGKVHRARYRKEHELPCPLQAQHSPQSPRVYQPGSSSHPSPSSILWRFQYIGMID